MTIWKVWLQSLSKQPSCPVSLNSLFLQLPSLPTAFSLEIPQQVLKFQLIPLPLFSPHTHTSFSVPVCFYLSAIQRTHCHLTCVCSPQRPPKLQSLLEIHPLLSFLLLPPTATIPPFSILLQHHVLHTWCLIIYPWQCLNRLQIFEDQGYKKRESRKLRKRWETLLKQRNISFAETTIVT